MDTRSEVPRAPVPTSMGLGWLAMGGAPTPPIAVDNSTRVRCVWLVHALADETNESFYDVTIRVQDQSFLAHRAILAVQSPVFRAMFTSNMREQHSGAIELGDASPRAFAAVLRHAYGASIEDEPVDVLVDIWELADRLQMESLLDTSTRVLTKGMLGDMASLRNMWATAGRGTRSESPSELSSNRALSGSADRATTPTSGTAGVLTESTSAWPVLLATGGTSSDAPAALPSGVLATSGTATPIPPTGFGGPQNTNSSLPSASSWNLNDAVASIQRPSASRLTPVTFLAREIGLVLDGPAFLKFPYSLLERLLSSDSLVVSELLLFERAMFWIAAEPSREIRLDDVLSAIRFSTMTVHELKEASKNPTANKSSSFHSILLKVLLGHYEAAAPRVLTRPEVVLSSMSEGPTPFVLNGRVFNVLLSHVSGRRSGISVTVSGSVESKISGVFLLPYARQKDGRNLACGRVISLGSPGLEAQTPSSFASLGVENDLRRNPFILNSFATQQRALNNTCTLWDVDISSSVDVALQCFTRPGANISFGNAGSIPITSPFLWDADDFETVGTSTALLSADWFRSNPASGIATVGLTAFNWQNMFAS